MRRNHRFEPDLRMFHAKDAKAAKAGRELELDLRSLCFLL